MMTREQLDDLRKCLGQRHYYVTELVSAVKPLLDHIQEMEEIMGADGWTDGAFEEAKTMKVKLDKAVEMLVSFRELSSGLFRYRANELLHEIAPAVPHLALEAPMTNPLETKLNKALAVLRLYADIEYHGEVDAAQEVLAELDPKEKS